MNESSILKHTCQPQLNTLEMQFFQDLMPLADGARLHKDWWKNDTDEGGKNMFEEAVFSLLSLQRLGKGSFKNVIQQNH